MYRTLIALLFTLPLAAPVAATQYLRVVNAGATPIVAMEATPVGTTDRGQLSLAERPLHPGGQLGVALGGMLRCRYDLRLVYADGGEVRARGFNVCQRAHGMPATLSVDPDEA